ncbi:MAG TPA: thioredoxin family protein [Thermoanaerobaculia bacterium]|nr:thioredoxin family protein [Thermoanaerobaculia bacterium]
MQPKALLLLVVVTALTTGCVRAQHAAFEGWYEGASGLERALDEQKANGKPVLLYLHTEWCGWCKKLESDVFRTSNFETQFGSVLKVRLNPEENRANDAVIKRFPARGYPTVYVITKGEARGPIVGYMPPDAYLATLRNVLGD